MHDSDMPLLAGKCTGKGGTQDDLGTVVLLVLHGCCAATPVCPRCGTTLLTLAEFEDRLDRDVDAEVGPMFDFVRSLS
jgi:hypothetical protein